MNDSFGANQSNAKTRFTIVQQAVELKENALDYYFFNLSHQMIIN